MIQSSSTINRHLAQIWVLADNQTGLSTDLVYGTLQDIGGERPSSAIKSAHGIPMVQALVMYGLSMADNELGRGQGGCSNVTLE